MKRSYFLLWPWVGVALTGCNSQPAAAPAPENEKVSLFHAGKGVWFSEETTKLFGLQVAEAGERVMAAEWTKPVQVYRAGGKNQPAAATVALTAAEAAELKPGLSVRLLSETGEVAGQLVRLDAQAEGALGQVEALLEFADPDQRHPTGSVLTALVRTGSARTQIAVPESAVLAAATGTCVYTINGAHLTRTCVKTGVTIDGFVAIEEGLYAGDSVATHGIDNLWLVELSALKGGTPCCPVGKKSADK